MPLKFGRGLWIVTGVATAFTLVILKLLGPAAIDAGEWILLGLIGLVGFLVWSVGLGILFLLYGRR
jgi:hypothetical protein